MTHRMRQQRFISKFRGDEETPSGTSCWPAALAFIGGGGGAAAGTAAFSSAVATGASVVGVGTALAGTAFQIRQARGAERLGRQQLSQQREAQNAAIDARREELQAQNKRDKEAPLPLGIGPAQAGGSTLLTGPNGAKAGTLLGA